MNHLRHVLFTLVLLTAYSCSRSKDNTEDSTDSSKTVSPQSTTPYQTTTYPSNQSQMGSSNHSDESDNTDDDDPSKIPSDGTHSATVDYYNPNTGTSATYTLDVEVEDGQIVQIDFPSGGYLDSDHITPADIDEDGSAHVEGEDGKTYDVQLDDE